MSKKKTRYYLDKIGWNDWKGELSREKDSRNSQWRKERNKYGFDERDTWNLDATMAELLYERLCMFDEVNIIDTNYHKVTFEDKEYTQQEAIDLLKELLRERLLSDDFTHVHTNEVRAWKLWSVLIEAGIMWW